MKRLFLSVILLALGACTSQPSQSAIQTAIVQTQGANSTYTPLPPSEAPTETPTQTPTEMPTETPTITPSSTPDLRVIDINPYKLLLQKTDCPLEGKYFLPNGWMEPLRNSKIVAQWTVEKGQEYLAETGRIDGWIVDYARGNANALLPQEIWDNVILYSNANGAQIVVTQYDDRYVTESNYQEVNDPPKIGDLTRIFIYKETDESNVTRVWLQLAFSYRNIVHEIGLYGYEKEVSQDIAVNIAQTLLSNLEQLSLSDAVSFRP